MIELEQRDEQLLQLNLALDKTHAELRQIGQELSEQRRKVAPKLAKAVMKQLADLGFKQSHFEVALRTDSAPDLSTGVPPAVL